VVVVTGGAVVVVTGGAVVVVTGGAVVVITGGVVVITGGAVVVITGGGGGGSARAGTSPPVSTVKEMAAPEASTTARHERDKYEVVHASWLNSSHR
jgi:hypothetical protein